MGTLSRKAILSVSFYLPSHRRSTLKERIPSPWSKLLPTREEAMSFTEAQQEFIKVFIFCKNGGKLEDVPRRQSWDDFSTFLLENIYCDPSFELSHRDSSDKESQHMLFFLQK